MTERNEIYFDVSNDNVICEQGRISGEWFARHVMYQNIEGTGKTKDEAISDLAKKVVNEWKIRSLGR